MNAKTYPTYDGQEPMKSETLVEILVGIVKDSNIIAILENPLSSKVSLYITMRMKKERY